MKPDARKAKPMTLDEIAFLVAEAAAAAGSRKKLAEITGVPRRRIQYLEHGGRRYPGGRVTNNRLSYPEQYLFENLIRSKKP